MIKFHSISRNRLGVSLPAQRSGVPSAAAPDQTSWTGRELLGVQVSFVRVKSFVAVTPQAELPLIS